MPGARFRACSFPRPPPAAPDIFPIVVDASGRFLRTATGVPFRLQNDAAWVMGAHTSVATQDAYLDGIVARGFNSFTLMNIVHAGGPGWPNVNEPNDFDGVAPFATPGVLSTRNDAYFTKVSSLITRAKARPLAVTFFHSYIGAASATDGSTSNGDGWCVELVSNNTNSDCFNWGVYLANKFTQANIIWMHGGDNFMSGALLARFQQIVAGIQSVTRNRLSGAEWNGPNNLATSQAGFTYGINPATSDLQLGSFYGGGPSASGQTYVTADLAYQDSVAGACGPAYMTEPAYENAWYAPLIAARHQIRAANHWAITAGALGGCNAGAQYRWDWQVAQNPLNTIAGAWTLDLSYSHALYQSLSHWLMRPSGTATGYAGRVLVVSGAGSGDSQITSCMTSDGVQLLAYIPPTGTTTTTTLSVDLRSMSSTCTAYWWNPTTGVLCGNSGSAGSIGTFANSLASQSFTTPGDNGTGRNDWVLVCKVPS